MKPPTEFYAAFGRAGFLSAAVWTAQPAGAGVAGDVRYRKPSTELFGDAGVLVSEPSAQFPATQFTGIRAGDRIDIGAEAFRVRELHALNDGAELRATLVAWGSGV